MPDWVTPLIVALFSSGGLLGSLVLLRKDNRQAPVERETAMIANAMSISTGYKELVATVNARLAVQDAKVDSQGLRIDKLQAQLDQWSTWYYDLTVRWLEHRKRETAPPPPE